MRMVRILKNIKLEEICLKTRTTKIKIKIKAAIKVLAAKRTIDRTIGTETKTTDNAATSHKEILWMKNS